MISVYHDVIARKLRRIWCPSGVKIDSGWNCTPSTACSLWRTPIITPRSVQAVTEDAVLKIAAELQRETGLSNLCLAGGVALNCVANGRLLREGPFERLWIQPAAGDAGGALGVALAIAHTVGDAERKRPAGRGADGMRRRNFGHKRAELCGVCNDRKTPQQGHDCQ